MLMLRKKWRKKSAIKGVASPVRLNSATGWDGGMVGEVGETEEATLRYCKLLQRLATQ